MLLILVLSLVCRYFIFNIIATTTNRNNCILSLIHVSVCAYEFTNVCQYLYAIEKIPNVASIEACYLLLGYPSLIKAPFLSPMLAWDKMCDQPIDIAFHLVFSFLQSFFSYSLTITKLYCWWCLSWMCGMIIVRTLAPSKLHTSSVMSLSVPNFSKTWRGIAGKVQGIKYIYDFLSSLQHLSHTILSKYYSTSPTRFPHLLN